MRKKEKKKRKRIICICKYTIDFEGNKFLKKKENMNFKEK